MYSCGMKVFNFHSIILSLDNSNEKGLVTSNVTRQFINLATYTAYYPFLHECGIGSFTLNNN